MDALGYFVLPDGPITVYYGGYPAACCKDICLDDVTETFNAFYQQNSHENWLSCFFDEVTENNDPIGNFEDVVVEFHGAEGSKRFQLRKDGQFCDFSELYRVTSLFVNTYSTSEVEDSIGEDGTLEIVITSTAEEYGEFGRLYMPEVARMLSNVMAA